MFDSSLSDRAHEGASGIRAQVPHLGDVRLGAGDRWVYSAGFNVGADLRDTKRIDEELPDLACLVNAGCAVALLAHQGNARDGSAGSLDHVAGYLQHKLGRNVGYVPQCVGDAAQKAVRELRPGEIVLLGNTRFEGGEERNDPELARIFGSYGDRAVVGGFCKAHRSHASNVGLLRWLPGFASTGLISQAEVLLPWIGKQEGCLSIAAFGGLKREKTTMGLRGLIAHYDHIIVGGAVLNLILAAQGRRLARSLLSGGDGAPLEAMREILDGPEAHKIILPERLLAIPTDPHGRLRPGAPASVIAASSDVPDNHAIVDWEPGPGHLALTARLHRDGGRLLVAGPPSAGLLGYRKAISFLEKTLRSELVDGIVLGGDSTMEIRHHGATSSGGGAALELLSRGTTAVFEAVRATASAGLTV